MELMQRKGYCNSCGSYFTNLNFRKVDTVYLPFCNSCLKKGNK